MRIVLTGGGTGGHLAPLLALHEYYESVATNPDVQTAERMRLPWEWLYIGSTQGIERKVTTERGIRSEFIMTGKLRRYFSLATLVAPFLAVAGIVQSWNILRRFRPHLVFCSGGYVAFPVAWAARMLRIPVILHEQTVSMGLANRQISRFARKILVSYPSTVSQCERGACAVVGNPVRQSLISGSREKGFDLLGFTDRESVVLILGGAQGCHFFNDTVLSDISRWLGICQLVIATGDNPDHDLWKIKESSLSTSERRRLRVFPFIKDELGDIMRAADVVISRSGAGTIAELIALQKPALLVPLPGSAGGEQSKNAQVLVKAGAALALEQESITAESLFATVETLLGDREQLAHMQDSLKPLANTDAAQRILSEVMTVVSSDRRL